MTGLPRLALPTKHARITRHTQHEEFLAMEQNLVLTAQEWASSQTGAGLYQSFSRLFFRLTLEAAAAGPLAGRQQVPT